MTRRYAPNKPTGICAGCVRRYTMVAGGVLRKHGMLFPTKGCKARLPLPGSITTGLRTGAITARERDLFPDIAQAVITDAPAAPTPREAGYLAYLAQTFGAPSAD